MSHVFYNKKIKMGKCFIVLVAQSVKHPTLDFGSGHVLRIVGSSPTLGSMLESA